MSQLFDRIRGLAGCDRVEIVLVADHAHADARTALQLADSLARAAQVPQLTVWVLPTCEQHALRPLQHIERVDLPGLRHGVGVEALLDVADPAGRRRRAAEVVVVDRPAVELEGLAQASMNSGRPSLSVSPTWRLENSSALKTLPIGPSPSTSKA